MKYSLAFIISFSGLVASQLTERPFGLVAIRSGSPVQYSSPVLEDSSLIFSPDSDSYLTFVLTDSGNIQIQNTTSFVTVDTSISNALKVSSSNTSTFSIDDSNHLSYQGDSGFIAVPRSTEDGFYDLYARGWTASSGNSSYPFAFRVEYIDDTEAADDSETTDSEAQVDDGTDAVDTEDDSTGSDAEDSSDDGISGDAGDDASDDTGDESAASQDPEDYDPEYTSGQSTIVIDASATSFLNLTGPTSGSAISTANNLSVTSSIYVSTSAIATAGFTNGTGPSVTTTRQSTSVLPVATASGCSGRGSCASTGLTQVNDATSLTLGGTAAFIIAVMAIII